MWISDRRRPGKVRVKRPAGRGLRGSHGDQRNDTRQSGLWERHGIAQLNRLMHDLTDGAVLRIVRSARVGMARRHDRSSHQRDRQGYAKHAPNSVPSQRVGPSHRGRIAFQIDQQRADSLGSSGQVPRMDCARYGRFREFAKVASAVRLCHQTRPGMLTHTTRKRPRRKGTHA